MFNSIVAILCGFLAVQGKYSEIRTYTQNPFAQDGTVIFLGNQYNTNVIGNLWSARNDKLEIVITTKADNKEDLARLRNAYSIDGNEHEVTFNAKIPDNCYKCSLQVDIRNFSGVATRVLSL